jgi:squalene-associated FAD-dependent desaturase
MRIHVVGAGLAGLTAAWRLAEDGYAVTLYEAAPQAGGRCRSFFDERLGCVIDNGGHVVLGANRKTLELLHATGGITAMTEIAPAAFPFYDLNTGEQWVLRPSAGPLPWWIFSPGRRVPGTRASDYLGALALWRAGPDAVVDDCLPPSTLRSRLWEPFATAVMNTGPRDAAARPVGRALLQTFGLGERGCRAWLATAGLSAAFADPMLRHLTRRGADIRLGWRLARIRFAANTVTALEFDDERVALTPNERMVLAVPHHVAGTLLPGLDLPIGDSAIVNAHYRLDGAATLPGGKPLLGVVGSTAQWLIARGDVVSVTVSDGGTLVDRSADDLLDLLWSDVGRVLGIAEPRPPARLIKERRATFTQTPENQRRRQATTTPLRNLFMAGDWTATGLPATIEGAVRSGLAAARAATANR